MCKSFERAEAVIQGFIERKEPFIFEQLQDAILDAGGVLRVAPGVTISDYLDELEEKGKIEFFKGTGRYRILDEHGDLAPIGHLKSSYR